MTTSFHTIVLTSRGEHDLYMTNNPEISFFTTKIVRHLRFQIEPYDQSFNTPPSFGNKVSCTLSKTGDLITNAYLKVIMPVIQDMPNGYSFAWCNKVAFALIEYVEIEIGNTIISRLYSDWINIWYELNDYKLFEKDIIDNKELTKFSTNKKSVILYIPLPFWFSRSFKKALPIVSLYNTAVKINVKFNSFKHCHLIEPSHYINVNDSYLHFSYGETLFTNNDVSCKFIRFDVLTKRLYFTRLSNNIPMGDNILRSDESSYTALCTSSSVNIEYIIPTPPDVFDVRVLIHYVHLPQEVSSSFKRKEYLHTIENIQYTNTAGVSNSNYSANLPFHGFVKEIWFSLKLSRSILNKDHFNYSNNKNKSLCDKITLHVNNQEFMSDIPYQYFNYVQTLKYHNNGNPSPGIHTFSFALHPSLMISSSHSKSNMRLHLSLDNVITETNLALLYTYAISHKILHIKNGSIV